MAPNEKENTLLTFSKSDSQKAAKISELLNGLQSNFIQALMASQS